MKHTLSLAATITALLAGCATRPNSTITIPPEVRKISYADERLFHDLLTGSGGVGFADVTMYPRARQKALTRIQVLTPYDNKKTGVERWYIQHDGQDTAAYLVKLTPDGHGGTSFTVQMDQPR